MPSVNSSFGTSRKLATAKAREFSLVDQYKLGYRNREDVTNLPPGVMIVGSQNVMTNVSERVQIRQGYSLDGAPSTINSPVSESFDWLTRGNGEVHMRVGDLTSVGNDGRLQYRYVDSSGNVTWEDLTTGLSTVAYNFTTFWNTTESLREVLFVNGTSNIFRWNGAIGVLASVDNTAGHIISVNTVPTAGGSGFTANDVLTLITGDSTATVTVLTVDGSGVVLTVALKSVGSGYSTGTGQATGGGTGTGATIEVTGTAIGQITISGNNSVLDSGFYASSNLSLVINGHTYTYTNIFNESFLGISPNASGEAIGSLIVNAVITTPNSAMTDITATFKNGLIRVLNNQVFVGSLTSSVLWISKVNSYTDYSSSTPRQTGEGASLILDANLVGLDPQENFMYVTAGQDLWYNVNFQLQTSTVDVTYEQVNALPLKTGRQQAAISQAFVSHMKNNIIVVTQETTVDTFGRVETSLATPQTVNISDPIKLDIDSYDFTDGSIFYWRYYILVAIPKEGLVLMYNLANGSWESPQTIPISRFYIVDGALYGHSYNSFESYQLFTGYADRVYPGFLGYPIPAVMKFSYENYGTRFTYKKANSLYMEGYISPNTTLTAALTYELDGCATTKTFTVNGSDTQIVCIPPSNASLGKQSLGKQKLGGDSQKSIQNLPPKFRVEKTFNSTNFFEVSFQFSILGTNQNFQLLAFGLNASSAAEEPIKIRQ